MPVTSGVLCGEPCVLLTIGKVLERAINRNAIGEYLSVLVPRPIGRNRRPIGDVECSADVVSHFHKVYDSIGGAACQLQSEFVCSCKRTQASV